MSKLGKNKKNTNDNKKKKEQNKKDQKHAQVVSVSSTLSDTTSDGPLGHGNDVANSKPDMRCKFHSGRLQSNVCVYMPKQMFTICTKKNRLGRAAGKS